MLLCVISMSVSAQEHLTFKGIPIDGTPKEFGSKLTANGFEYQYDYDGVLWYEGPFAGYNNCKVAVKSSNNLVYEVVVIFPTAYSWNALYSTYISLKNMLTQKYGDPYNSKEEFINTPSYIDLDDDNDKFYEVGDGHCSYGAIFFTAQGTVALEIKQSKCVGIHYEDAHNIAVKESAAIDDL